jgi:PAS domain-containing protein
MDHLQLDFEQARAKHLLFKSKLRSILYGIEIDETPVLSHFECAVGKWIYEHALNKYGQFQEMQDVERVHADLHRKATELVGQYHEGQVEEARSGLVQIEMIAENLVSLLSALEEKLKVHSTETGSYQDLSSSLQELQELSRVNHDLDRVIKNETAGIIKERWLLQEAFMQIPASISILKGPEHIIQFANPEVQATLGRVSFLGNKVKDVFPELAAQGYIAILDNVYRTGEPFIGKEMKAVVHLDGKEEAFFSNVSYSAIRREDGEIEGILAFSYNVSEQVLARKQAEEAAERLKQAYEDLEIKVKFRNIDLERANQKLQNEVDALRESIR